MRKIKTVVENGIDYEVEYSANYIFYYKPNTIIWHREGNLPSIIWDNGDEDYYVNDVLHRENGPARVAGKDLEWWYHGCRVPVTSQDEFEQWLKLKCFI